MARTVAGQLLISLALRGEVIPSVIEDAVRDIEAEATLTQPQPDTGLREALLLAVEEVDNAWHDEGTHIEWDEDVLPERLIALRSAYHAHEDAPVIGIGKEDDRE